MHVFCSLFCWNVNINLPFYCYLCLELQFSNLQYLPSLLILWCDVRYWSKLGIFLILIFEIYFLVFFDIVQLSSVWNRATVSSSLVIRKAGFSFYHLLHLKALVSDCCWRMLFCPLSVSSHFLALTFPLKRSTQELQSNFLHQSCHISGELSIPQFGRSGLFC